MKLKFIFLLFFALSITSMPAGVQASALLTDEIKDLHLGPYIEYIEDRTGELTFDDIRSPINESRWRPNNKNTIDTAFSKSAFWIRFKLTDNSELSKWFIQLHSQYITAEYYQPYKNRYNIKQVGVGHPVSNKDLKIRGIVFAIDKSFDDQFHYMKIEGPFFINLSVLVIPYEMFIEKLFKEQLYFGFIYGFFALFIIINLIIYLYTKELSAFYMGISLLSYILYTTSSNGFGFLYLWPDNTGIQHIVFFISIHLLYISFIFYSRKILDINRILPSLNKILNALIIFFIAAASGGILFYSGLLFKYNIYFLNNFSLLEGFSLVIFFIVIASLLYLKYKYEPARIYLEAFGVFLIFQILNIINVYFIKYQIMFSFLDFGFFSAIIILNLAVIKKISLNMKNIQADKDKALNDLYLAEKKSVDELETKVEERTYELAEANSKLQELDKLKSNFFANISHEIRTPLTLILSPIESVLQGDYGKEIDNNFFINLQRNAIRLLKLINNLLDFSKIEAGRMNLKILETDIVKFIRMYIGSVHSAAESRRISLNFKSMNESLPLFIDREKMDKIIMNIFSNALKFTDCGGSIEINIKEDENSCYIEFTDTGIGIPDDKLNSIFDRFSQADASSTRKFEGTGIGLALTKELVTLHNGTITVKSTHIETNFENHGTTFTVSLPKGKAWYESKNDVEFVTSEELDESVSDHRFLGMREMAELRLDDSSGTEPEKKNTSAMTILVVEDNSDMRNFLKSLLTGFYNVHTAENGQEGYDKAKSIKPDLIVSDVMMPIMNGFEMTEKIKQDEELKRTPVLMITARSEITNKIEGLESGADDYLTKPFNSRELFARIRTLLKTREYEKEISQRNFEIEQEMEVARLLQRRLLPESIKDMSGYNSHALYIPMDKVGGDFYDYTIREQYIDLYIADVSGHGLPGAFLAMMTRMSLESVTERQSTNHTLSLVNNIIYRSTVNSNFVTAFLCRIDSHTNILKYSNAGHVPPLVYRKKSSEFFELNAKGKPLGWFKNIPIEENEFHLLPGDRLILFTDGITECENRDGELFGDDRFKEFILSRADLSAEKFCNTLIPHLNGFSEREKFNDDLTLLVFDVE